MTISEALAYYRSLEVFGVQPGLERITALLRELGDPQEKLKCVHVAGTNGKGSVCTELSSILTAAGYKVGLYTSPYVIDFRERIQLNGEMISEEALCRVTETVKSACERVIGQGLRPTAFEVVTAAAFLFYSEEDTDIVILETGLGGRFDATNVIRSPLVSVITSISMDHVQVLGNTLAEIANEKSGIIKLSRPLVTPEGQPPEAFEVIRTDAKTLRAPFYPVSFENDFEVLSASIFGSDVRYRGKELHVPFCGLHQLQNASLVLKTVELLKDEGFPVTEDALRTGLAAAFIPARAEVVSKDPLILIDGAHNPGGAEALDGLLTSFLSGRRLLGITGMMRDKDVDGVLKKLLPHFSQVIALTPSNPRAISAPELSQKIQTAGIPSFPIETVGEAVQKALEMLPEYDGLIVFGSLYLASDIRSELIKAINQIQYIGGNTNAYEC